MENQIYLTKELMRSIARYETDFSEIMSRSQADQGVIACPEVYTFTLEDLYEAIRRLKEADPLIGEFGEKWFHPIVSLAGAFDLARACGMEDEDLPVVGEDGQEPEGLSLQDEDGRELEHGLPDDVIGMPPLPPAGSEYPGLKTCDSDYFAEIWLELEYAWEEGEDEERLSGWFGMDRTLEKLERWFRNREKPVPEWEFTRGEKEDYIEYFADDIPEWISGNALALARTFLEELCEGDSTRALYIKGYACYGGNRLYPCDWAASRDCMLRLYEKTDKPQYADTLGYIYYYGRCTGGKPEYEKAFRYFSIAAANGLYEGCYKLADMYLHGYACKKSPRTARALYEMVYDDTLGRFLKGQNTSFADAALRMGNVYAKGIGCIEDPITAFSYYLQAEYAAKMRARESDFFGNQTVVRKVQNAIDEILPQLPEHYVQDGLVSEYPNLFWLLCSGNQRTEISVTRPGDGQELLRMTRIPTRAVPNPEAVLMTIPERIYCRLTLTAAYLLAPDAEVWTLTRSERVRCDYCCVNEAEDRMEFFCDDSLVAWVRSAAYRLFEAPEK